MIRGLIDTAKSKDIMTITDAMKVFAARSALIVIIESLVYSTLLQVKNNLSIASSWSISPSLNDRIKLPSLKNVAIVFFAISFAMSAITVLFQIYKNSGIPDQWRTMILTIESRINNTTYNYCTAEGLNNNDINEILGCIRKRNTSFEFSINLRALNGVDERCIVWEKR